MTEKKTYGRSKRHRAIYLTATVLCLICICYIFCLPKDLFSGTVYSTVITDRNGELLGARIADDGQWRFPPADTVPERFAKALIEFEDRHFRLHPGVNPVSLVRAASQNIRNRKTVSGGSTITMQVIRMSRQKERNLIQKGIEAILATRLELRCTKDEILALYTAHAPFGGNVVGLEAASWRYFGRPAEELSWGESATLAVLPNSPSIIHPGKNRALLKEKRDRLLARLRDRGTIDNSTYGLAISEALPEAPLPLPQYAPHLTESLYQTAKGKHTKTSIDLGLQKKVELAAERWRNEFSRGDINDLAAIIINVHTSETVAYCGNADFASGRSGSYVDILRSPRSTGSILKPFLYCAALQDGEILPGALLPDIPVNINGFSPQNFDLNFYGAVPADQALARSLNVPAVNMLRNYGVPKFHDLLKKAGMSTLTRPASDYGLSLILGGAEGSLAEITAIYANMAAIMNGDMAPDKFPLTDRTAIHYTFEALKEVNRPDEMDWKMISSVRKVAWKTGTSFGFRDGWAVGVTPDYAVGVWAGNASGQGSPGLTGARTAGPVMFDLFNILPRSGWFSEPDYGEYITAEVCRSSGHLKGIHCDKCDTLILPKASLRSSPCPYHREVTLTNDGKHRAGSPKAGTRQEKMFILPPSMEWYYKEHHPEYRPLPPLMNGTPDSSGNFIPMDFIYPESGSTIYLPKQIDGTVKGITVTLAHSNPETTVYWHLDDSYMGETRYIHNLNIIPSRGKHTITAVDADGNTISTSINID